MSRLGVIDEDICYWYWLLFCRCSAVAQQPWQGMQMPTAAEVQRVWKTPPAEYGPEPYYGLNGAVDEAVIRRDLDTMKSLGYGR